MIPTDTARIARIGLADAGAPANGAYLETVAGESTWSAVCRTAGVATRVDSGVSSIGVNWASLHVRRIDPATVGFTIGANPVVAITANIPTLGFGLFFSVQTTVAAIEQLDIAFAAYRLSGLAR